MSESAKLLSPPTNYAVVQLPGRHYPGVVVQGDSLHSLLEQVESIRALANRHKDADLSLVIADLYDLLSNVAKHFEMVCEREGLKLPY